MSIRPSLFLSALLFFLPGTVPADPPGGGYIGKDEVAAEARRQVNGRILSIRLHEQPGAPVYRVKVLKDGDVYQLNIPAKRNGTHNARPRR